MIIKGACFKVSADELKKHLEERHKHHQERWEYFKKEEARHKEERDRLRGAVEEGDETSQGSYSNVKGFQDIASRGVKLHWKSMQRFKFLAEHVRDNDGDRLLHTTDLEQLELIRSTWE
jgi:hypothetical protein